MMVSHTGFYKGKTVLVTGASSGIGLALCKQLAGHGAELIMVARDAAKLSNAVSQVQRLYNKECRITACPADISQRELLIEKLSPILEKKPVDLLLNNAGIASCRLFEDLGCDEFEAAIQTNYLGQVWMTKLILPGMRRRNSGVIANVSSMAGAIGMVGYTAYGASKFALIGFTESLRNELSSTPIRVALILPSDVDTPQLAAENKSKPASTRAISGAITPLSPTAAAQQILSGLAKGKTEIIPAPFSGQASLALYRRFPGLGRRVLDHLRQRQKD